MIDWQLLLTAQGNQCWQLSAESVPYVELLADKLSSDAQSTFVVTDEGHEFSEKILPRVIVSPKTKGALCTALVAIDRLDLERPLLIAPGDFSLKPDIRAGLLEKFSDTSVQAFSVTMDSSNPKYSFARIDENQRILEYCEKDPVSKVATTGIFGFKTVADFVLAATWVLKNNISLDGRFFVSSAVNYFIMNGKRVENLHLNLSPDDFYKNWSDHEDRQD
jgi:hypothetical protein